MSDSESSPSGEAGLASSPEEQIVDAMISLQGKTCRMESYTAWQWCSTPREKAVIKIQRSLLPSLKQQLTDLLAVFGLGNTGASKDRDPQIENILDMASKLSRLLGLFGSSFGSLSPWVSGPMRQTGEIDASPGMSKKMVCDHFLQNCYALMYDVHHRNGKSNDIYGLLDDYINYVWQWSDQLSLDYKSDSELKDEIIIKTALLCRNIDGIIGRTTRSGFGLLQHQWQLDVHILGEHIQTAAERLDAGALPGTNQAQTNSDQANRNALPGPIKPRLMKLFERAITLAKLTRIFLHKLSGTPTRKSSITIGDHWSCEELDALKQCIRQIHQDVGTITKHLVQLHDGIQLGSGIGLLEKDAYHIGIDMDDALTEIARYIVPVASTIDPPPPEVFFKNLFSEFSTHFRLAVRNFKNDVEALDLKLQELV